MELNAATPISKCVSSKLGILVVQRHYIWLICPHEGLGCEVPMEYHDFSFRVFFFLMKRMVVLKLNAQLLNDGKETC